MLRYQNKRFIKVDSYPGDSFDIELYSVIESPDVEVFPVFIEGDTVLVVWKTSENKYENSWLNSHGIDKSYNCPIIEKRFSGKICKDKKYVLIQDTTREVLPVFFSDDGKVLVVFKLFGGSDWDNIWLDSYGRLPENLTPSIIEKQIKLRPWRFGEVPIGTKIRNKFSFDPSYYIIEEKTELPDGRYNLLITRSDTATVISNEDLFQNYEINDQPCGVME